MSEDTVPVELTADEIDFLLSLHRHTSGRYFHRTCTTKLYDAEQALYEGKRE